MSVRSVALGPARVSPVRVGSLRVAASVNLLLLFFFLSAVMGAVTSPTAWAQGVDGSSRGDSVGDTAIVIRPDWNDRGEPVPRHLFSIVNYPRFWVEGSALAQSVFEELNPKGTQARIETWISLMEPANDDDDPFTYNWSRFRPDQMFRFIDDPEGIFLPGVGELGMAPVLLLTYNVGWLARHGRPNDPPYDPEEWAEFAAAVLHASEMRAPGLVEYVEIWNEPSERGLYWSGTMDEYFELFETVLRRLRQEFPGVKVGGPSVLGHENPFFRAFVDRFGHEVDYLSIHFYNDPAPLLVRKVQGWGDYVRRVTGRSDLRLMVTEADNWNLQGEEKVRYLLERQFGLLEIADYLEGFHQFSLPVYGEGGEETRFGFVFPDGAILAKNYWAYWLFRDYDGVQATVRFDAGEAASGDAGESTSIKAFASFNPDDQSGTLLLYLPPDSDSQRVSVALQRQDQPQTLVISLVDGLSAGIHDVRIIGAGEGEELVSLTLKPGAGAALTVRPQNADADLLVRVDWVGIEGRVGSEAIARVTVWNAGAVPGEGHVVLRGFPGEPVGELPKSTGLLGPGEKWRHAVRLRMTQRTERFGDAVWFEIVETQTGKRSRSIPEKAIVR